MLKTRFSRFQGVKLFDLHDFMLVSIIEGYPEINFLYIELWLPLLLKLNILLVSALIKSSFQTDYSLKLEDVN